MLIDRLDIRLGEFLAAGLPPYLYRRAAPRSGGLACPTKARARHVVPLFRRQDEAGQAALTYAAGVSLVVRPRRKRPSSSVS
jgi:hypothetical protein